MTPLFAGLVLSGFLSGCTVSKQLESASVDQSAITGAISPQAAQDGLNETDVNTIKRVVASTDTQVNSSHALAWVNPDTGNSGAITAIENAIKPTGLPCKRFETTVNSFSGLSIYNGETCETRKGFWTLSWLSPKS